MKTLRLVLLCAYACFGQQIDLTKQVKGVLPAANGGSVVHLTTSHAFTLTNGTNVTGDLSSAGAKTVTLSGICPSGLNGNDANHQVYISGGTGTAEAVLITGGTARDGVAGGTLTFTTANVHTGAWTLTSATAGFQEAVQAAGTAGIIEFPPGDSIFRATGTVPVDKDLEIRGAGPGASKIKSYQASGDTIYVLGNTFGIASIHDLLFYPQAAKSSGVELRIESVATIYLQRLHFVSAYTAVSLKNCNTIHYGQIASTNTAYRGMVIQAVSGATSAAGNGLTVNMAGAAGIALDISAGTGGVVTAINLVNTVLQQGANNLSFTTSGTGVAGESSFANLEIDSAFTTSVRLYTPTPGNLFGISFTNVRGGSSNPNVTILDAEAVMDLKLSQWNVNNAATAPGIVLRGCKTASVTSSLIGATQYNILLTVDGSSNVCDNITINGSQIGYTEAGGVSGTYGVATSAHAHTAIRVDACTVAGSTAALDWHATGAGSRLGRNTWVGESTKPDATTYGAALKGSEWWTTGGAGAADALEVLRKAADNSFAWVAVF